MLPTVQLGDPSTNLFVAGGGAIGSYSLSVVGIKDWIRTRERGVRFIVMEHLAHR